MIKKKIVNCRYELKFDYYVTDDGRVWSDRSNKFLNPQAYKDGYQKVQLMSIDGKRHRYFIHRLVLENFCPIDNMSELQINKFFNTSGMLYRSMNLKESLKVTSDEEKIQMLASDGMLIKRPILVLKDNVLVGFKEDNWLENVSKK